MLPTISQTEHSLPCRQKSIIWLYRKQDISKSLMKKSGTYLRNINQHSIFGRVASQNQMFLNMRKIMTAITRHKKPVKLLEDLIQTYSNEGNTVLDFTMGSGSTGVVSTQIETLLVLN